MFNMPDLKWFVEFLKVSGWKTAFLSLAAGALIYFNVKKALPVQFQPWLVEVLLLVFVVCGCLALATLLETAVKPAMVRTWRLYRFTRSIPAMIATMDPKEKEIIGYLLMMNLRGFTYSQDAGYASSLVAKGLVVCTRLPGQRCNDWQVPFEIPESAWKVLMKHKRSFPCPTGGGPFPWAIHYMNR